MGLIPLVLRNTVPGKAAPLYCGKGRGCRSPLPAAGAGVAMGLRRLPATSSTLQRISSGTAPERAPSATSLGC